RGPPAPQSQIADSVSHGFSGIRIDAASAVGESTWEKEIRRATQEALRALSDGSNPLVFTGARSNHPSVAALGQAVVTARVSTESVNDRIGSGLGRILDAVV